MFMNDQDTFEQMYGPAYQAFEQWISLFPVAPMFGVEWRFAPMMTGFAGTMEWPGATQMPFAMPAARVWAAEPAAQADPVVADVVAEPVAEEVAAEPAPAAEIPHIDIQRIRGIGPKLADELRALGVATAGDIAAMTEAELAAIDAQLTAFRGRCFRDDWIGQAKALIAG